MRPANPRDHRVALAPFLAACSAVTTLGIRASINEYSPQDRDLLLTAKRVFFPTPRFIEVLQAIGKPTFPNPSTYRYQHSRLLQEMLFQYLGCPHPQTRIYFGNAQKRRILDDFHPPFLVMSAELMPETAHLIEEPEILEAYLSRYNPVIIQRALHWAERIRMTWVYSSCIAALRCTDPTDGANPCEPIPLDQAFLGELLPMSARLASGAQLDDIQMEWGYADGAWQVIELKRPPVRIATPNGIINRHQHICELIQSGKL